MEKKVDNAESAASNPTKKTSEAAANKDSTESGTNGVKAHESIADKKTPLEDGEIKEDKKERQEKIDVKTSGQQKDSGEASKMTAKETSKVPDVVLPEFTRIQVTKLSRNVTQVCGMIMPSSCQV